MMTVKESDLLLMVHAFRNYKKFIKKLPEDEPIHPIPIRILSGYLLLVEASILDFIRVIHRKYDGLDIKTYMKEVEQLLWRSPKRKLSVTEKDLIEMVKAFRSYRKVVEQIAEDQPAFQPLIQTVKVIEGQILEINRVTDAKYFLMDEDLYLEEIEKLLI